MPLGIRTAVGITRQLQSSDFDINDRDVIGKNDEQDECTLG